MKKILITIPALNELEVMPQLVDDLRNQSLQADAIIICVNQPENWWQDEKGRVVCENNLMTIKYLENISDLPVIVVDKSSRGKGWKNTKCGVGLARKAAMDHASGMAGERDVIVSLDADTRYPMAYLQSVKDRFDKKKGIAGLAIPYFHNLSGEEKEDRAMLRYELYLRYYSISLYSIGSPHAPTPLGSILAVPAGVYRKVGGITPKESGEDFYFLQKMLKHGRVAAWNDITAYPSSRLSSRVLFGTGPALIKGLENQWDPYPFFPYHLYLDIAKTYSGLEELFTDEVELPLNEFLNSFEKEVMWWEKYRRNTSSSKSFIKACHRHIDGLKIYQYLRQGTAGLDVDDEGELLALLKREAGDVHNYSEIAAGLNFETSPTEVLDVLRRRLFDIEMEYRLKDYKLI